MSRVASRLLIKSKANTESRVISSVCIVWWNRRNIIKIFPECLSLSVAPQNHVGKALSAVLVGKKSSSIIVTSQYSSLSTRK